MITRRFACCTVLIAALATGCASASTTPVISGHSPGSTAVSPPASNAASPTSPVDEASPTATSIASAPRTPASSATDGAVRMPEDDDLAAGRYFWDDRYYINASRLTFTVPAGWNSEEDLYKDRGEPGEVKFTTWVLTHVFSDVCQWRGPGTLVDVGTTVDELITALMEQEGRDASAPTSVTVGGFPAKRIQLTVPAELDTASCTNGVLRYWPAPGPNMSDGDCCALAGSTDTVYVVDIAGNRLVVVARHIPGSSAANRAELQSIVDSIEIVL